jgi:hypothetical protein
MEHVLASNIMRHGEDNGILYQLQHGFRRNRSCETQLVEFMDFAKAFDKVNHSLLVHKIHQYGIRGKVNSWIKSWLSGRNQTVVVEGVNSSQVDADSGIPQGSVLEPSLFIFYINDLQDRLRSTVRLFADDTIAYLTITSEDDAEHLQEDLDKTRTMGRRLVHAVPSSKMYSPHRHQQAEPHSDRVYHSRTITFSSDISQIPGGYHHRQSELEHRELEHRFHHKQGE